MINDLIILASGTILGFGASIATIKYQEYEKRKRAFNIFNIELYKIDKLVSPFTTTNNQYTHPDTGEMIPFNGVSIIEIPNFKIAMQIDILIILNEEIRELIYNISLDLEYAERYRLLAIPLLDQIENANKLGLYSMIYLDYLKSAKVKIDDLKKENLL
jgi:hypothetical protein